MTFFCGIYGYEITEVMSFNGITFTPKYYGGPEARQYPRDTRTYHLTAIAEMEVYDHSLLFDLEGILAFIERLDVLISLPVESHNLDVQGAFLEFPAEIRLHERNNGGGCVIPGGIISKNARCRFITAAMSRLSDAEFCKKTEFRGAFFKCVETFRSPKSFLDVSYYFLFSALESFARGTYSDYTSDAAVPINRLLQEYGFNIKIANALNLKRAISTYAHIRNALFHTGKLEAEINLNGRATLLKLTDYYGSFSNLLPLVMMKAVGFDDSHINWDGWAEGGTFL
ncbi:MAG: hypothetical protein WDO70_03950 [Alphaproteobacteria bacterium]